jgi:hypothetical protein
MAFQVRRATYHYLTIRERPGEAYRVLSRLARLGVNLHAFNAVPIGVSRTQFALFPEDDSKLKHAAEQAGFPLDGPYQALLVQGDDEMGALAGVHQTLFEAGVNVYASAGVADGRGSYGYVIYIQPDQYDRAVEALGI